MASSSRIETILRSVAELDQPVHVRGQTPASRALLVARWAISQLANPKPLVVLCADDDAASELAADVESLSVLIEGRALSVIHLPTWEQSPYSPITPSLRIRLARVAALSALSEGNHPDLIVTTIAGSCQATLSRAAFVERSCALTVAGSVASREALAARLVEAGYLRTDTIEDPGSFAVRGELIDVFPVDRERPIRIELFDDEVERIREFDPTSQRAFNEEEVPSLKNVTVPPAREVLVNRDTASGLRERLKARADDLGIPRAVRDPVMASIAEGMYPGHSDIWAPFAYGDATATFWDYLLSEPLVAWCDELSCQQAWDEFLEEQKRLSGDSIQTGIIGSAVDELFRWGGALEKRIRLASRLFLDRIDLANLESVGEAEPAPPVEGEEPTLSARHQTQVRDNTDLAGSRHDLGEIEPKLHLWMRQGFRILGVASTQSQVERIRFLLEGRGFSCQMSGLPRPGLVTLRTGAVSRGFRWPAEGLVVLTDSEFLGSPQRKKARRATKTENSSAAKDWSGLQALSDLSTGDAVVHVDHGIGRYQGLVRLDLSGAPSDFLLLEYANKDRLYLPVYRLNVIQKYVGAGEAVNLDKLGTAQFARAKDKVRESVRGLAIDLIQLYAERKIRAGFAFSPRDAAFSEFEARFPFDETADQLKAIDQTIADLESGRVMDRLVCGDVGYGKTEVAMRAAFKAVSDGKQVAVLVPTTVLAYQHEQSFRARLKDYPINIESVSRFKSAKDQKTVLASAAEGKVDIVIGTHRLLSKDVAFRDLGLIIVDEEHRFGVEHKEKLKTLKTNTHVLTLTATPIPRTLHMALSGLRDISLINTPPADRLPIRTYVSKYDEALMQRAIEFELKRGGQVYVLHNRVQSIYEFASKLRTLVPAAQVCVGHGQMTEGELEEVMVSFYQKRTNVLVCTTIIESGLDVPTANTMIIHRADSLGLAQLYQIRGRVGRGQQRAYAYLMIPAENAITEDAKRRLEVIQRFVELGSGFSIASHDLEIRGGGDLLGPQQSGHINAVGFDLYTELLEEAIQELQGKPIAPEDSRREPEIKTPFPAFLSDVFVPDVHQRLSLYRRFSGCSRDTEVDQLEEELRDRFGELPAEAQNLMWLIRIKVLLKRTGIDALTVGAERVSLVPGPSSKFDPVRAIALVSSKPADFQLTPDSKFVARMSSAGLRDLFFSLEELFKRLMPPSALVG